ncbi:tyrosine--tRNA ligase [Ignisphaera sp. 4213-co]|uniref:Tyrosine--tRNA ligase n=1 Tax=Ignisphaera cupida TaxID=3050454 RepID=A0ABD4Z770_9CREN|nr:tyrosine--tRNA ligase [Ignisphaera sp. 4213-co]MDK6028725.1 tyrosine--tRNA ligase [Ignisphaera sp. 4213-co]
MDVETRFSLIKRNTMEIVTEDELRKALEEGRKLRGYLGFEPSGISHIGWLIWMYKFKDLVDANVEMILFAATWHAWINDKLGGNMELIRAAAKHVARVLEAIGVNMSMVKVVYAEELVERVEYWEKVIRIAKHASLSRVKRALTIMGRKASEGELDFSKLIYPLMQVADIFQMDLDIALGGMDQRKAHMLARDVAEKLGYKKPIAIHTPLLPSLKGFTRMDTQMDIDDALSEVKMSKSKPEEAIFLIDDDNAIVKKIRGAYCPPREVETNPVMAIAKHIIFAQGKKRFVIERKPEHGGDIEVYSYDELENLYRNGSIHPLDLKNAVANELIKIIKPIRNLLQNEKDLWLDLEVISHSVTR